MNIHTGVIAIALLALTSCAVAGKAPEAPPLTTLDGFAAQLMKRHGIAGIGIVAVENGHVIHQKGFGTADGNHAFDDATRFYIASNTKAFTGMAMAHLVDQGRIHLDDPVTRYIPPRFFAAGVNAAQLTIRDLLTHTTGLADDPLVFRTAYSGQVPSDPRTLLRFAAYRRDDHSRSFHYSNLGYLMAAMIIRRVTGKDWKTYLQDTVLQPAGMHRTGAHVPPAGSNAALPFEAGSSTPMDFRKSDATLHAAGGLFSTLPDMGMWLTVFTDPQQKRLAAADVQQASRPLIEGLDQGMGPFRMQGYGYGWIHGSLFGEPLRFHFGRFPGYDSMISYAPDRHRGVFVYVNTRRGGLRVAGALSAMFYAIMRHAPDLPARRATLTRVVDQAFAGAESPLPPRLLRRDMPAVCGVFTSARYGTLSITADGSGYGIRLGDLQSVAYRSSTPGRIGIAWIPGKREYLDVGRTRDGRVRLSYQDYGVFVRAAKDDGRCRDTP